MIVSSVDLDRRRRSILFRARRRGCREMDLVFEAFTQHYLLILNDEELREVEAWLDVPEPLILAWIMKDIPLPAQWDTPLFAKLAAARSQI